MTLIRSFVSTPSLSFANLRLSQLRSLSLASQYIPETHPARLGRFGSIRFNSQPRKPAAKMSDLTHPTIKGEICDPRYLRAKAVFSRDILNYSNNTPIPA